ncbi:MAG: dihydroneopterin aldolase [Pseudomonadota bacterium]|uniref:dihydroneopterin aldolase n=1 Tax=Polaromonas sp. TaxID=1869339 RepID=UPI0017B4AF58|nr:dihydroneopterin aldolase [Polaromonas sp.]MBA3594558.1 dihydroneopterin aldolase [Polaromonas sp.]MDQ3270970.1 dihydroneopterin aldolase [Pseudomonadota bacterium]
MRTFKSTQVMAFTGFRFQANLGILAHELAASQPIEVSAELNMGEQSELPEVDQLEAVLDYRKVHDIIIEECTAVHVNMLESLTGKVCQRLMRLPGVIGVRVKIVKLEIFADCAVSIQKQIGAW